MSTPYLLVIAAIAAVCLFFAKRKKGGKQQFVEEPPSNAERYIRVYDMEDARLQKTIDEFIGLYSDNGDVERPTVTREGKALRLTFSSAMNYITMCYWVNYLVYADENREHHFKVRGWYPFGEVTLKGKRQPFSDKTAMLYVDKDDKDGDNIDFVTPDSSHFRQPFPITDNIRPIGIKGEEYTAQ